VLLVIFNISSRMFKANFVLVWILLLFSQLTTQIFDLKIPKKLYFIPICNAITYLLHMTSLQALGSF